MHCPTCTKLHASFTERKKAKVVKTENSGHRTHRIYRCTHEDCDETFHTIEIPRDRFRELETLERSVRAFADRFHR